MNATTASTVTSAPSIDLAEVRAHQRAMPLQRLIGNGMDYTDAHELHARAEAGIPWSDAATELGDRNRARAADARSKGHRVSARQWYLNASACYRAGQNSLPDSDPRKIDLYRQLIEMFGAAGELREPAWEHLTLPVSGGMMSGWLLRPTAATAPPPAVIILGGFDGWREEYVLGAMALVERGVACLLLDLPGQGETRLLGGVFMNADTLTAAFSVAVDALVADPGIANVIGVWGNSLGGNLAALTAIGDRRITACCVNGGTIRPAELPERHPRFISKVQALFGTADAEQAMASVTKLTLTTEALAQLSCPLLVLHGTPDTVFLVDNARALFDGAAASDKAWHEWPDGDHCLYNHTTEKHVLVGDWFADRLLDHHSPSPQEPHA